MIRYSRVSFSSVASWTRSHSKISLQRRIELPKNPTFLIRNFSNHSIIQTRNKYFLQANFSTSTQDFDLKAKSAVETEATVTNSVDSTNVSEEAKAQQVDTPSPPSTSTTTESSPTENANNSNDSPSQPQTQATESTPTTTDENTEQQVETPEPPPPPPPPPHQAAADFLERGELSEAMDEIDRLSKEGTPPPLIIYNTLLFHLQNSKDYADRFAFYLQKYVDQMVSHNIEKDVETFNILINFHVKADRIDTGKQFLEDMKRQNVTPNAASFNPIIVHYVDKEKWKEVKFWSEQLKLVTTPDAITYTALIRTAGYQKDKERAISLYEECIANNFGPSTECFNLIMGYAVDEHKVGALMGCLHEMRSRGIPLDEKTYKHLIFLFSTVDPGIMKHFFDQMKKENLPTSQTLYDRMTDALNSKPNARSMSLIVEDMKKDNMLFKFKTFMAMLHVYGKEKRFDLLQQAVALMIEKHVVFDHNALNTLITACLECGRVEEALGFYHKIVKEYSLIPESELLKNLVKETAQLGWKKETYDVVDFAFSINDKKSAGLLPIKYVEELFQYISTAFKESVEDVRKVLKGSQTLSTAQKKAIRDWVRPHKAIQDEKAAANLEELQKKQREIEDMNYVAEEQRRIQYEQQLREEALFQEQQAKELALRKQQAEEARALQLKLAEEAQQKQQSGEQLAEPTAPEANEQPLQQSEEPR